MKKLVLAGLLAPVLLGCSTAPNPADVAIWSAAASRPLVCANKQDCDTKWNRAVIWVTLNSAYKIMMANDTIIQTFGPMDGDVTSGFLVTRVHNADGSGLFVFQAECGNMFGCIPPVLKEKADFVQFVMGPPTASEGAPATDKQGS